MLVGATLEKMGPCAVCIGMAHVAKWRRGGAEDGDFLSFSRTNHHVLQPRQQTQFLFMDKSIVIQGLVTSSQWTCCNLRGFFKKNLITI